MVTLRATRFNIHNAALTHTVHLTCMVIILTKTVSNSTTWLANIMTALYFLQGTNWTFNHYSIEFGFQNRWIVIWPTKILTILWTKMSTPWEDKSLETFTPCSKLVQSNSYRNKLCYYHICHGRIFTECRPFCLLMTFTEFQNLIFHSIYSTTAPSVPWSSSEYASILLCLLLIFSILVFLGFVMCRSSYYLCL